MGGHRRSQVPGPGGHRQSDRAVRGWRALLQFEVPMQMQSVEPPSEIVLFYDLCERMHCFTQHTLCPQIRDALQSATIGTRTALVTESVQTFTMRPTSKSRLSRSGFLVRQGHVRQTARFTVQSCPTRPANAHHRRAAACQQTAPTPHRRDSPPKWRQ